VGMRVCGQSHDREAPAIAASGFLCTGARGVTLFRQALLLVVLYGGK
jgi:hypothetical protein